MLQQRAIRRPKANMQKPIRTCALVGKFQDPRVAECAAALVPELLARQLTVLAPQDANANRLPASVTPTPLPQLIERTDLMIAIGGDGTLLYAAGLVAEHEIPLLGINRGRLGFLTDGLPQDMVSCLTAVLAGDYEADRRALLQARQITPAAAGPPGFDFHAVVFNRLESGRLFDFEPHIDGRSVNSHGGDGMVV